jgi:23S rRNA (pseudouridine1915-N3)-methyltransferase
VKIVLAVVGKARHATVGPVVRDYEERAARYWPLVVKEVREESSGSPEDVKRREGERLLAAVPKGAHVVVCDERGSQMTSPKFSAWLQKLREQSKDVCFLIGGAHGLSDEAKAAAQTRLALGELTMPHEMARAVLAEQLYRAGTIVKREPYHK